MDALKAVEINPISYLSKVEHRVTTVHDKLSIPYDLSNLLLRPLLHKQALKINKWIKSSLKARTKLDLDTFMEKDKTLIDKNSLQYRKMQEELLMKQDIQSQLKETGGYLDKAMLAFEMSEKKVISDICTKLQLPVKSIVPIFKLDQTEEYLRNLDMEKLREQVLKE